MTRIRIQTAVNGLWALGLVGLLLLAGATSSWAAWVSLGGAEGAEVGVTVLESSMDRTVLEFTIPGFYAEPVVIDGTIYQRLTLPGEASLLEPGLPELPKICRSLIVDDRSDMEVDLLEFETQDLAGFAVAPSKGNLLRTVDPADVPYPFGTFYGSDDVYPEAPVRAGEPYILRDYRGMVVELVPFVTRGNSTALMAASRVVVEVRAAGPSTTNVILRDGPPQSVAAGFADIYTHHFVNWGMGRYVPTEEAGRMVVITHDAFHDALLPLVEWKNQMGQPTSLIDVSTIGNTATAIDAYITNVYQTEGLTFVLLVGDAVQIATPHAAGGASDPSYALIAGSDNYPEILVGRFSAETLAQAETQVARTIAYEKTPAAGAAWYAKGTGIASNQGPGDDGEMDYQHVGNIRTKLLAYTYTDVDGIYDPNATIAMVTAALNEGRSIIDYCGHGSTNAWTTTGFSNSNVNALQNAGMLPFIFSVACVNGQFEGTTCFAEAWLRATQAGEPTGAVGAYMSSINQSWNPPMAAQDEAIDLLVGDQMRTFGALCYNGSCLMIDEYGAGGAEMYLTWHVFGDPSLRVRTAPPVEMEVQHDGGLFPGQPDYAVNVPGVAGAQCTLYADGILYGSATTDGAGSAVIHMENPPVMPGALTLTVTAYNKVPAIVPVNVLPPDGPYLVLGGTVLLDAAGDADGEADAAESLGLDLTLRNIGIETATGVTATIASDDPYVTLEAPTQGYGAILPDSTVCCLAPFLLSFSGSVPDQYVVPFQVHVAGNEGSWDFPFSLVVSAPVLAGGAVLIDDSTPGGNGNGVVDPGETFFVQLWMQNSGHAAAWDLTGLLSTTDQRIQILDADGTCLHAPAGSRGLMSAFQVQTPPDILVPAILPLDVELAGPAGFTGSIHYEVPIGAWADNAETDRGWALGVGGDTATGGVWVRTEPIGTLQGIEPVQPDLDHTFDPGSLCFVTGNGAIGGAVGDADVDGGRTTLLSPVFALGNAVSATLGYWRWYTNDLGNNPGQDAWTVEVTADGTNWVVLEQTTASANEWTYFVFDLGSYVPLTDQVRVRFVAVDDSPGSLVEAAVDDLVLTAVRAPATDAPVGEVRAASGIVSLGPNPLHGKGAITYRTGQAGRTALDLYDVSGRRVRALVDRVQAAGEYTVAIPVDGFVSGIYFVRLETAEVLEVRQIAVVR
jgi:hypothetical protein